MSFVPLYVARPERDFSPLVEGIIYGEARDGSWGSWWVHWVANVLSRFVSKAPWIDQDGLWTVTLDRLEC